jgi:hypothetical protein
MVPTADSGEQDSGARVPGNWSTNGLIRSGAVPGVRLVDGRCEELQNRTGRLRCRVRAARRTGRSRRAVTAVLKIMVPRHSVYRRWQARRRTATAD